MSTPLSAVDRKALQAARAKVKSERAETELATAEEDALWFTLLGKGVSQRAIAEAIDVTPMTINLRVNGEGQAVTTDLVTYNTNGLTLKPGMAFDDWQGVGETLFKMEHLVNWALGDWWVYGERTYGESAAQAAPTGYALKTLQNAAWVADRIEPSRRREDLTWSHHCEVAALEPAKADELLSEAAAENWTRNDLRAEVRRVKHPESKLAKPAAAISEEEIAVAIDLAEDAYSYVEPFYREKWGMDERLAATQITKAKLSPEVRDKFWRSS